MKKLKILGGVLVFISLLMLGGCNKETKTAKMRVKLMTMSSNSGQTMAAKDLSLLTAVNLDIRMCEMHYSHPDYGWFALPCHTGIYNVLVLKNDVTITLVHDTALPQGILTQFRWWLGTNNSIEIAGNIYPLKVPSGEDSGLKINLKEDIHFDHWIEVRLIFDPDHSIIEQGSGGYILTPVIQVDVVNQD